MTHTRPDGDKRVCVYDLRDRDISCTWDDNLTPTTTREYDLTGKLIRLVRGNREITYTYDEANFLRTESSTLLTSNFVTRHCLLHLRPGRQPRHPCNIPTAT